MFSAKLDFALSQEPSEHKAIESELLGYASANLIARKDHPLAGLTFSLENAIEYPFIFAFGDSETAAKMPFQKALEALNQKPRQIFSSYDLMVALDVLLQTEAVPLYLQQHLRTSANPAHNWLKKKIRDLAQHNWRLNHDIS